MLSDEYHANEGGHVRIYRADALRNKVLAHGLRYTFSHHAHALHSPFWWLKCAVGTSKNDHPAVAAYHKLLVWDMVDQPWITRRAEELLNPLVGKSVALYFEKPAAFQEPAAVQESATPDDVEVTRARD
jgi:hypothetical protein